MEFMGSVEAITEYSQSHVVEAIRNMAEFVIYAEKYELNYFEIMTEEDSFNHLLRFLHYDDTQVTIQLIQSSSILI